MKHKLKDLVLSMKNDPNIDQQTLQTFLSRLSSNPKYLKAEGVADHFCVGVLLINKKEKKIFMGHHIKSDHWMGAGGHMELGECPLDTVIRECKEELDLVVNDANLFDLTHFEDVNRKNCTQHYDFFYRVDIDTLPSLSADTKEFYEAGWLSYEDALKKKLLPKYRASLLKLLAAQS